MEPYYVIHKDTTTIKFPHQLSYSEFPHIDLVYLSKSELLKDVLRSYSSIKNVWNAFVVDGRRMYFYMDGKRVSLHEISYQILHNIIPNKRIFIAALCTQSVFALIYEKLFDLIRDENKFIGEVGDHSQKCAMHAYFCITRNMIKLSICKRLRIFDFENNDSSNTLDIVDINIDIQLKNYNDASVKHLPPLPDEVCVQLKYVKN